MSSLNVPGRSNSIKRTPSDLSRELAERELPEPEFLRSHENRDAQDRKLEEVGGRLAKMDGDEPEGQSCVPSRVGPGCSGPACWQDLGRNAVCGGWLDHGDEGLSPRQRRWSGAGRRNVPPAIKRASAALHARASDAAFARFGTDSPRLAPPAQRSS